MISSLRQCDGVSQTGLAEKLGVSKRFLNSVEKNKRNVSIKFLKKVSVELGYPVEPFLELMFKDQLEKEDINILVFVVRHFNS